jgi:hypothetical protein
VGFKSDQRSEVNETATIRRESPNGSDCERGAGVQSVGQGFTGLDFLVLLYQDKRTLIKGAVIRACLPARQGFKALDSTFGRQVFGSFASSGTSRRVGGKRTS